MPTKCFFKNCKSISDKNNKDKVFVPFVKPKTDIKRCVRWLQLSGRTSYPIDRISRNTYLCNDHFPPDEVLDWRKNANLDPIPLHRLKKVATAEVFRANYVHPTFLPNVESENNWVDEADWSDVEMGDDDKPNIAEKGRRNYSRHYKRAADIKQISNNLHHPNPNPGIVPHVESEDNWVDKTVWSDVESGDDDKPNLAEKGGRNYSRNYKRAAEIKQIRDSILDENLRKKLDDILSDK